MKKFTQTYRLFTLCILLFGVSIFLWNCEKENQIEYSVELAPRFKVSEILNFDINSNNRLANKLSKLNDSKNNLARDVHSSEHNFTVETDIVKYVENNTGYHSYTFRVTREENTNFIENLLASLQPDGSYKLLLIKYQLTPEGDLIDIEQNFSAEEIVDEELSNNLFSRGCEMELLCLSGCAPSNTCHSDEDCVGSGAFYEIRLTCSNPGGGGNGASPVDNGTGAGEPVGDEGTGGSGGANNGGNNNTQPPADVTVPVVKPPTAEELALDKIEDCLFPNGVNTADEFVTYNWLVEQSNITGNTTNTLINNFLQVNQCSIETKNFATLAIEAFIDDGKVDFENGIIIDKTFKDTKTKCIHDKLIESGGVYKNLVNNFNGTNKPNLLKLKLGTNSAGDWGITKGDIDNTREFSITINTNIENGSNLMKTVTLSHELIHAYMFDTLENWGYLAYDIDGEPILNLQCSTGIDYSSLNLNTLTIQERFVALICGMKQNGTLTVQWSHDIFNTTTFDASIYRQELENLIYNQHDWDSENEIFKNEMQSLFGDDWKREIAKAVSWIGLEGIDDYTDYLNSYNTNFQQFFYIQQIRNNISNLNSECI